MYTFFSSGSFNCQTNQAVGVYTINGSTPPYSYTIVNAVTNATYFVGTATTNVGSFTTMPVGTYSIFLQSSVPGCSMVVPFSVTSPANQPGNISVNSSPSCFNSNTGQGTVSIGANYFTPPFTYTWSNGANTQTVGGLAPGLYTITVNDNVGCSLTTTMQISSTPPINSVFAHTMISCFGGTLNSAITSTGGTAPYTYSLNGNAIAGSTATALSAGIYTLITKDAKGCAITSIINVNQPVAPGISFTITQPTCPTSTNGAVVAGVSNAPGSVTYTWQPIVSFSAGLNNIPAGIYTLSIRDGSACITKSVVNITSISNMNATVSTKSENCSAADGAFTMNVSGGTSPYSYSTVAIGNSTSNVFTGLSSGSYTTIITDVNNCRDTVKFYVGNLSTVSVSVVSSASAQCYGQCTGSVQLAVQNAVAPVTYSASGQPTTNSNIITGLCAGFINIKVIDALGCPATTTLNFPVPPVFSYSAANPAPVCIGKTVTLSATASGGAGGYSYVWNPGNMSGQSVSFNPSGSGNYSLNVYDQNGCTLAPFIVTVTVSAPLSINLNSSNSGICPGTTAQITPTITGGDGNYTYNWMPGNITGSSIFVQNITVPQYTLTVNDGCGSPSAVSIITINLFPQTVPTFSLASGTGCQPFCTQFFNTTPKSGNAIWNYGDKPYEQSGNTTYYCYEDAGTFNLRLTVTDSNSCKASKTYTSAINVLRRPVAAFVTDPPVVTIDVAGNVTLVNTTLYGNRFFWFQGTNSLGNSTNISYAFKDTGCVYFRLIAENDNFCRDTLDQAVCVLEPFTCWIPNAFTPNKDGVNDTFFAKGTSWTDKNYVFEIYNRWGKRIFKTNDVAAAWDGNTKGETDEQDRYFYHFRITDVHDQVHDFKGFVLLLKDNY
jgi:gliding motility-associated-like protein